ncbi:hypothetical protein [Methylosoma difficile]
MKNRMQAMIVASSLAMLSLIITPVSIVSSASVALVTLRRGALEGLYVLLCSAIASAVLGFLLLGNFQFALLYGALLWLPVWLISIVLREGRHLSLAVEIAVMLGVVGVIGTYVFVGDVANMWVAILTQVLGMAAANSPLPQDQLMPIQQNIAMMAHYMTGMVAAGSVFSLLFGLFLGRWWQANLYNPGGFGQEFLSLSTPPRMALGSLAIIAVAWLSSGVFSEVLWNIAILLFVLYTFIGSSVAHGWFAGQKLARFSVPMFYLTMLLVPYTALPVALIGLADAWLNLRTKKSTI